MLKKILLLILIPLQIFSTNVSYAIDKPDSIHLGQDQVAPYEGILLSITKASKIRIQLMQGDLYKDLSNVQQDTINTLTNNSKIYDEKNALLLNENATLYENLHKEQVSSEFNHILYFGLGILATVGAGFVFKKATQ